jgi:hypothetical protein
MSLSFGSREIVRNPSLLRIKPDETFTIKDKKSNKTLGVYIGVDLADEFFKYLEKKDLINSAKKIKESASEENLIFEESLSDGL